MDAQEVNRRLLGRMHDVVMYLYPDAKISGSIAKVGSIDGEKGQSMQIHIGGPKAGMFTDFANSEVKGGSPLWLWHLARGVTYVTAVREAKDWLGIRDDDYGLQTNKPKRVFATPEKAGIRLAESSSPAMDYLTIARRVCPIVIANNKIAESQDGTTVVFPYIDTATKKACHLKYLKIERGPDGKKTMWASKDTMRCLFGKNTIDDNARSLLICEGEIDKLSWETLGVAAVSVPMGVKDLDWIGIDWDWLGRFETIYLSFDMDSHGEEAFVAVAKRLGLHRCHIVKLPRKDINECLCNGFTCAEAQQAVAAAKPIEISELQSPTYYSEVTWDVFNPDSRQSGYATPWSDKLLYRVRPGELTVVSGFSGAGKTCGINHMIVCFIAQGAKVMDCSLEIKPPRTLHWMARQAAGRRKPQTKEELDAILQWLALGLWLFDYVGTANTQRMLDAMLYAVKRFGVDVIVIDSLFKCGIGSDDYNAQKEFIAKLTDFCRDNGTHIFLVAHSRKPPINARGCNEDRVPSKDEISGSSDIQNGAFNVLIIWRNKEKHRKLDELRSSPMPNLEAVANLEKQPDGRIKLDKQRFGEGVEREVPVFFDAASTQFKLTQGEPPRNYMLQ